MSSPTETADLSGISPQRPVGMVVVDEPGRAAREYHLAEKTTYLIGRSSASQVVIEGDERVSRSHGQLRFDPKAKQWLFSDAGSANGSLLNGRLVSGELPVSHGDVITLGIGGETRLHLVAESGQARPADAVAFRSKQQAAIDGAIAQAAKRAQPVLLIGPRGCGKSTLARQIHELSRGHPAKSRVTGQFVPINCGRLPRDRKWLLDMFFGNELAAGATAILAPMRQVAGGTLFLDEVDCIPDDAQTFLLELLENLGGSIDGVAVPRFRLIAASSVALPDARLTQPFIDVLSSGFQIPIPALADRREDIPAFFSLFARNFEIARGKRIELTVGAKTRLDSYSWPGDVRELQAVVHRLLEDAARRAAGTSTNVPLVITEPDVLEQLSKRMTTLADDPVAKQAPPTHRTVRFELKTDGTLVEVPEASGPGTTVRMPTTRYERKADGTIVEITDPVHKPARELLPDDVFSALSSNNFNLTRTSVALGISRNTLKDKIDKFQLKDRIEKFQLQNPTANPSDRNAE